MVGWTLQFQIHFALVEEAAALHCVVKAGLIDRTCSMGDRICYVANSKNNYMYYRHIICILK